MSDVHLIHLAGCYASSTLPAWDSGGDFAKVAAATARQAQGAYSSWLLSYSCWLRWHAPEDQQADIAAEMARWDAIPSTLVLDFSDSSAPAVQLEPVEGGAAGPQEMATQRDNFEEDVLAEVRTLSQVSAMCACGRRLLLYIVQVKSTSSIPMSSERANSSACM